MTLTEEEIKRLYRIQKTLMQMLKDRGYFIADSEITMTKGQFIRKYGDNMKREDLVTLKAKRNDNNDQVCLIWYTPFPLLCHQLFFSTDTSLLIDWYYGFLG